jgi:hypothetical protein
MRGQQARELLFGGGLPLFLVFHCKRAQGVAGVGLWRMTAFDFGCSFQTGTAPIHVSE